MKNIKAIKSVLFPNKRINILVVFIFILGVTFGSIFLCLLGMEDKNYVIDKITSFFSFINNNKLDYMDLFLNSTYINIFYLILSFLFGMTIFGILFIFILLILKGFILGFYVSSFILTYSYKGIFISFIYIITELLSIFSLFVICIYGIMF